MARRTEIDIGVALGLVLVFAFIVGLNTAAYPHDSWVSRGNYKNKAGEWCCGDYDCKSYSETQSTAQGWIVNGELVPYDAAETIDHVAPPDGGVTICRRPDGSRRCVFGLKPGI